MLRRYRLGRRGMAQAAVTEPIVVLVDLVRTRSTAGLSGRLEGWRLAASHGRRLPVPAGVVDESIGPVTSLRLRSRQ